MAQYGQALEQVENSIESKNKCLEDLRNRNKTLQAQVDELNKAHTSTLSDFSKLLEEKKNLEAILSNQKESIQALTFSLASTKEEVHKKDGEIITHQDACIDKFIKGANHMKAVLFQDFKEGKHLSWNVS